MFTDPADRPTRADLAPDLPAPRCRITGARACRSRHCPRHDHFASPPLESYVYRVDRDPVLTFGTVRARLGAPVVREWWGPHADYFRGSLILTARPHAYARRRRTHGHPWVNSRNATIVSYAPPAPLIVEEPS